MKSTNILLLLAVFFSTSVFSSASDEHDSQNSLSNLAVPSFDEDIIFLRKHTDIIVLSNERGTSRVAVSPAWQGRVMTSSTGKSSGSSFGWINRELITSGKVQPQINAFGGEDRFWLGPEGSQYSIFFTEGAAFEQGNWRVPAALDTLPFRTLSKSKDRVLFETEFTLTNYIGSSFQVGVAREVRLLTNEDAWTHLGVTPKALDLVAYESHNTLINKGAEVWRKKSGLLSIWILGMLKASPSTTVILPIKADKEPEFGAKVTTYADYSIIPDDRLQVKDGIVYFRGDAKFRSKIGISPKRSLGKLASYDAQRGVLTIVQFTRGKNESMYVNSQWGYQKNPYLGDVINSYNDGSPAAGVKSLGHFYELETSSPAAELSPGESLKHTHRTFHLTGPEAELDSISLDVLGVSLMQIETALPGIL